MKKIKLRNFYDALATRAITSGGITLIVIILGIMGFILYQTLPLWYTAEVRLLHVVNSNALTGTKSRIIFTGEEEQKEILYLITDDGFIHFFSLKDQKPLKTVVLQNIIGQRITSAASSFASHRIALGTDKGRVEQIEIKFNSVFDSDGRSIVPELFEMESHLLDSLQRPIVKLLYERTENLPTFIGMVSNMERQELIIANLRETENAAYTEKTKGGYSDPALRLYYLKNFTETISSLAYNPIQEHLLLGFQNGQIQRWSMENSPDLIESIRATDGEKVAVSAMEYLIGDISLIVGDEKGHVNGWMEVRNADGSASLKKIRSYRTHEKNITSITASWRNKSFAVTDASGMARLYHSTSEQLLVDIPVSSDPLTYATYSPKGDGVLFITEDGSVYDYSIDNPHPETTLRTLFGKVWYESYPKPTYTWQSTGGTDDFEPKLSLIPLIFGTLKATLYAMVFAVPLAILGAIYTSQFAHPKIRNIIKPTVEIMAALPSVVIGFIAGLWLAPLMKDVLVEFIIMLMLLPVLIVLFVYFFDKLPRKITNPFKHGYEVFLMIPIVIVSVFICYYIGSAVTESIFGGDVQHWLYTVLNIKYDQRNSIVIGVAMAFAVMPIIFTITEDSLASVPAHLTSASLALGASRWQTAIKVILPAASPGIFSAVMIGFGRAVGETMIVLMATGNTPIMDWSIFNGMRTLSANIAVEIPEAPHAGTLYRTLFLSGLLLFIMTFFVNTIAELVRQKLRKKYASL
ncbi:ABC transporter permease subunit [bacterium]|nr:ABC transporter permease subunit [bacterium]